MDSHIYSITNHDVGFPAQLLSIPNPPSTLYYRGDVSLVNSPKIVAIVGTRTPTTEGIKECRYITKWFVNRGYVIVSGLARGVDTITHEACLNIGGRTIAVLPSGIENIYPPENKELADKIVESGGLLLSEYPKDSSPLKSFFIQRNRLQTGLSIGSVVIESEISGGTMHTARFAIKQNRQLGCVEYPEDLNHDKRSGNRKLLSSGKVFKITRVTLSDFEMMLNH